MKKMDYSKKKSGQKMDSLVKQETGSPGNEVWANIIYNCIGIMWTKVTFYFILILAANIYSLF